MRKTVGVRTGGFKTIRNINVDNHINGKKSFIVDLDLYACFRESGNRFREWSVDVSAPPGK